MGGGLVSVGDANNDVMIDGGWINQYWYQFVRQLIGWCISVAWFVRTRHTLKTFESNTRRYVSSMPFCLYDASGCLSSRLCALSL
jgi:hypothetical protein